MICVAKRNNVLNGALHYKGDVLEAEAIPNANWETVNGQQYVEPAAEEPAAEEQPATEEPAAEEQEQPSEDHTVAQLKELAASRGIEVPNRATKTEILALLG